MIQKNQNPSFIQQAEMNPLEKKEMIPGWIKRTVTIGVSFLILYYYLRDYDWGKIIEAGRQVNLWIAIPAILIPQLLYWFFTTLYFERTITWFHGPFPFMKFFWIRGASYILEFVNSALGIGGVLLYQQRKAKIAWSKLMGISLFNFGVGLWGTVFYLIPVTLMFHYYGFADKVNLNMTIIWAILLFPGVLFFIFTWRFWFHKKDFLSIGKLIVRDRESEFWTAYNNATPRHWFLVMGMHVPPFIFWLIGFYYMSLAFNVDIPFIMFMAIAPFAVIIVELPIAFAGFGTTTFAWMYFFGNYGTPEEIAALTLFLPFSRGACRGLIGLISLKPALKELNIFSKNDEPDTEEVQAPEPVKPAIKKIDQNELLIDKAGIMGIRLSKLVLWMSIIAICLSGSVLIQDFFSSEKAAITEINHMVANTIEPAMKRSDNSNINRTIGELKHAAITLELIRETSEDREIKTTIDQLKQQIEELIIKLIVHE